MNFFRRRIFFSSPWKNQNEYCIRVVWDRLPHNVFPFSITGLRKTKKHILNIDGWAWLNAPSYIYVIRGRKPALLWLGDAGPQTYFLRFEPAH